MLPWPRTSSPRSAEAAATAGAAGRAGSLWPDHAPAPYAPARAPLAAAAPRRRPGRKRPVVVDLLAATAGIGLGVTIGLAITAESAGSLSAPGR